MRACGALAVVASLSLLAALALPATAQAQTNAPLSFTSPATFSMEENDTDTEVGTVTAYSDSEDDYNFSYAIIGGADQSFFLIGAMSGELTFDLDGVPNFEDAEDADTDNDYEVTVQATSAGTPEKRATQAITVTVTDDDTEAPGAPDARPTVTAASATSLTVTWSAPANAGPAITDYDYRYRTSSPSPLGTWTEVTGTTITTLSATIGSLSENTSYQVQVRATNAEGTGSWSASGHGSTMPLDSPDGFMASRSNEQVTLTWNAPDAGADITHHEYRFKTTGDYSDEWTEIDDSAPGGAHEAWVVVIGLTNDVEYTFQLRAVNAAGAGTATEAGPVTPRSGVCDRTEQVRDAIMAAISGVSDCSDVTTAQLASVTGLAPNNKGIRSLQSDDFSGLTALQVLRLRYNELSSLPDGVFSGLTALQTLTLNDNELSSLPDGVFSGLTALQTLTLNDNELSSLPDGPFSGLTALKTLTLNDNELSSLPDGPFSGLTALSSLHLQNNELSSLPARAFTGLTALGYLDLNNNKLSSLPDGAFSGLTALGWLRLQNNQLSSLPAGAFTGLTALSNLYLNNNKLSLLPDDVFSGLTALSQLHLHGNTEDPLPLTVTLEKVDSDQVRAKVLAGAPFTVEFPVTVANGALDGGAIVLSVAVGSVDGTAVTVTRTAGTTAAVTADIADFTLATQPTLPAGHFGYLFTRAASGLPKEVFPLTDANAAPTFSSSATFDAAENQTAAGTVLAADSDTGDDITGYAITGGADQTFFSIGATSGALTFKTAPNFEDAEDADTDNEYEVTVQATSGTGTRVKTATQTIAVTVTDDDTEKPAAPAAPAVSAASVTSLTVTWTAPANAGPAIDDYDVQYREGTSGSWTDGNHAGTALTATLTGLSENTSYQVQVRATNAEGTGSWSDSGSGTTDANAAPSFSSSAAFDAAENQTAAGTVLAADSDTGDDITGYAITGGADQGKFSIHSTSGALTFKAAPNFEDAEDADTDNEYEVTVQATSGTGTRVKTATQTIAVTVTDDDTEKPAAPAAPAVSAASVTSLTVTWTAPANAGPAIDDYDVQYREGTSGSWTDGNHAGTALTATLTGLSENTSYQVQVRATNAEGTGSWSDSGSGTTDANAAPSFSSSAAFDAAENQTAAGTVLATDGDTEDDVTGYAITGGADQGKFSIHSTSGALTFKAAPNFEDAEDADTDNEYEVTVQATSGTGTRVKTATQTITVTVTDDDTEKPAAPAAPAVSAASVTSLTVTWTAPANAGPAITDYDVQYRAGTSGSWTDGNHAGTALTATLSSLSENTSYQVQVRATNAEGTGSWSDSGSGTTDANAAPSFSSSAAFDAAENQTAAGTVVATDGDTEDDVTGYAITGGADQGKFSIHSTSGALTFKAAPNFEDAEDADTDNEYEVTVQATSGTGTRVKTATQTITVTVTDDDTEKPAAPAAPAVSAASVTSLTVTWTAPANAGPAITDYDVQYRAGTSGSWTDGNHAGTALTATLSSLSENTSYQVQVRATNAEGTGSWSDSGSGTTDANAAPSFSSSAAFDAAENQTAAGTVVATDGDTEDDVTGYAITGGADQGKFSIHSTSGALTFKAAPNFEDAEDADTDNEYEVTVQATSGTGTRVKTATQTITVTVTDDDTEKPAAPAAPAVSAASVTSLTVTWTAPANAGPAITDYDVQYRAGTSGSWTDGNHAGTALTATLSSLSENTSYQVQVRATNAEGTGSWSDSGSGTTDANAAPAFSSSATFDAAENQTAAGTVVAADSDTGDDITGYAITGGADQGKFSIHSTSGALTFKAAPNFEDAEDADTDNEYEVTVQATSGTGTRVKTATQTITVTVTDDDTEKPAAPAAPAVSAASVTSLTVTWTAPANAGPAITDYDVQYRAGTSGSWTDGNHAGTALTATLSSLSENTSYQVQVRATNAEGTGSWSDSGSGTTDANAAPSFSSSAAFDAAENQTAAGTVVATDGDTEDDVTGYAITGGADQGKFSIHSTSGALTFKAAPNFEDAEDADTDNEYEVTVQATSGTGTRVKTATQTITVTVTDADEKSAKPDKPTLEKVTGSSTSLVASWTKPGLNGGPEITGYDVQYREAPAGGWMGWPHDDATVTTTITGLTAGRSYQARVRAKNGERDSEWSEASEAVVPSAAIPLVVESVIVASAPQSGDTYRLYETILFTVTFSEPVEVKPHGRLRLEVGLDNPGGGSGSTVEAVFSGLSQSQRPTADTPQTRVARHMHFEYKVQLFDRDVDGVRIGANALRLASEVRIRREGGSDAELDHAAVGPLSDHKVDGGTADVPVIERIGVVSTPRLRSRGGRKRDTYGEGENIRIEVRFDQPVHVEGDPTLALEVGDPCRSVCEADYESGSGTDTLVFAYLVLEVDIDLNGIEIPADPIEGDSIRNAADQEAQLSYRRKGTQRDHKVDGSRAAGSHLSVEDAEAHEADGAMEFTVRLEPHGLGMVRVDYATAAGTARAGSDYTETSGTLTFESLDTERTVSVPILDDAHEDSGETFTLTLSNPDGAELRSGDGEATGTIHNSEIQPLTASFEGVPAAHDGSAFRFRVAFSEDIGISYRSLREDAFTVTGGRVTRGARVDDRRDLFEMTVEPDGGGAVTIELPAGRECGVSGAICTKGENRRQLTNSPSATVAGPPDERRTNTAAAGAPAIVGTPRVGETLTASTSGIADADGLDDARFAHQWMRADADIPGATGPTYTAVAADEGRRLKVRVGFTDDAGHAESLASAATDAVAARSAPLTASFEGMPAEHRGEGGLHFRVAFSEDIGISYRSLREDAFAVSGGRVTGGRRVDDRRDLFRMTVRPDSDGDVTITLPAGRECGVSGAICTKGDNRRQLTNSPSATVTGPVGISVADARVEEGDGAVLAFLVTLSRAAGGTVAVDYATANGSAHAGADYRAASGTLEFRAGESSKTVEVAVFDDSHDEGEETLTLRLSNASSGRVTDAEATGTIKNTDPLPRALLARFGRTAAVQVVEQVEARLEASREPGFRGRVAGRELRRGMERDIALGLIRRLGGAAGVGRGVGGGASGPMGGASGPMGMAPGMGGVPGSMGLTGPMGGASGPMGGATGSMGMAGPMGGGPMGMAADGGDGWLNGRGFLEMGLGGGDVLTGSAFTLNRETRRSGALSLWSRGARSRYSGREGALSLGGDVSTTMFGADYAKGPLVVGLSLSNTRGLGEYSGPGSGRMLSSVTGLYPWLGYRATDRITVWGVTGYGVGGMLLTPGGGPALESGLSTAMAAAGTRGELVGGGGGNGFALAFKADALWAGTGIDGVDGPEGRLVATSAAVTRVRTGLEGSRGFTLGGGLSLRPSVEVGLRHDGGDAETGAGVDVGGGLVASHPSSGLAVDVRVRTLLVHEAEGFSERGVSLSLSWNPTPSTPLGLTARLVPSWGGQATSGADALWGRDTMAGLGAPGGLASGNRLDAELGYGLPVGRRFVGTPRFGLRTSGMGRDYRLGYGLGVLNAGGLRFELGVDAQRRESPVLGGASNGVVGRVAVQW